MPLREICRVLYEAAKEAPHIAEVMVDGRQPFAVHVDGCLPGSYRPISCGLCHKDVTDHRVVGWIELDYGPELDLCGWHRLCLPCYEKVVQLLPPGKWPEGLWPNILTAILVEPKDRTGYAGPPNITEIAK